jgi:hypothetical protein
MVNISSSIFFGFTRKVLDEILCANFQAFEMTFFADTFFASTHKGIKLAFVIYANKFSVAITTALYSLKNGLIFQNWVLFE